PMTTSPAHRAARGVLVASLAIVSVTAVALGLAGCAATVSGPNPAPTMSGPVVPLDELDVLANPRSHVGESTAVLRAASITPVTTNPAQELPVTIISHDLAGDTEVTVSDTSRILGLDLAGSIAATIAGLGFGDRLVGRDTS